MECHWQIWDLFPFIPYKSGICYIFIPYNSGICVGWYISDISLWQIENFLHTNPRFGAIIFYKFLICIECMLTRHHHTSHTIHNISSRCQELYRDVKVMLEDLYGMFEIFVTNPRFVSKRCWRFVIKGSLGSFIYRPQILYKNICSL